MNLRHILNFYRNSLDNCKTGIVKSMEKELEFVKQKLVNKNKLIELCTSKIFDSSKVTAMVTISILILTYQL